jgi:poly(3-hydroxybutyrate) depolymerase
VDAFLNTNIVEGPVITAFFVSSAAALVYLLWRRPTRRRVLTSAAALLAGGLIAVAIWFLTVRVFNLFGVSPGHTSYLWLAATCAGACLAAANLWDSRAFRKSIAAASVVLFLVTGILGVNAGFGLNRTVGSLLGISTLRPIALTPPTSAPTGAAAGTQAGTHAAALPAQPLWRAWKPPSDMPVTGTTGSQVIPNTLSGFTSRPAGIYLPPAALVANPPALPLVILLMGQPGAPDPQFVADTLNRDAAAHNGLAPIVIVADQLGDPGIDPLCLDTARHGNAESFLTRDVVNWARVNLNIITDHRYWTIAGYSNGGQCAISLAAKHPDIWSNVIDISGEEFPGSEIEAETLRDVFGGDQAAYDAQKPVNLLAGRHYPNGFGVFTVGSNDAGFIPGVRRVADAAAAAGMTTTYWEAPNGGHVIPALPDGLDKAFEVLYPRLELSAPPPG